MSKFISDDAQAQEVPTFESTEPQQKPAGAFSMKNLHKAVMASGGNNNLINTTSISVTAPPKTPENNLLLPATATAAAESINISNHDDNNIQNAVSSASAPYHE